MTLSKHLAGAAIVGVMTVTGATAQDIKDWSGFYAGVGLGSQHTTVSNVGGPSSSHLTTNQGTAPSSAGYGATIGTDTVGAESIVPTLLAGFGTVTDSHLYLGLEGELALGGAGVFNPLESFNAQPQCDASFVCGELENQFTLEPVGRLRAIVGAPTTPDIMFFGSAGIAVAKGTVSVLAYAKAGADVDSDSDSASSYLIGATVGGGVDIKATHNLLVRVETAVDMFPTAVQANNLSASAAASDSGTGSSASASLTDTSTATFSDMTARVALIWQF